MGDLQEGSESSVQCNQSALCFGLLLLIIIAPGFGWEFFIVCYCLSSAFL